MYIELTTPQNRSGRSSTSCGPGVMPRTSSAANSIAIDALAGMPSVSSGMNDDVAAALFAVSGAATPSTAPRPNRSGVFDDALLDGVRGQRRHHRAAARAARRGRSRSPSRGRWRRTTA